MSLGCEIVSSNSSVDCIFYGFDFKKLKNSLPFSTINDLLCLKPNLLLKDIYERIKKEAHQLKKGVKKLLNKGKQ